MLLGISHFPVSTKLEKVQSEWIATESDDMFTTAHYVGGFDATEKAFCFSYFDSESGEYWFQFSLPDALDLVSNHIKELDAIPAE